MKISIGDYPKISISAKPSVNGHVPFSIEGSYKSCLNITHSEGIGKFGEWLMQWSKSLSTFPITYCMKVQKYDSLYLEYDCSNNNIEITKLYEDKKVTFYSITIRTITDLNLFLPKVMTHSSWNEVAVWGFNGIQFSIELKEWTGDCKIEIQPTIVARIEKEGTIGWVSYDADGILLFSNDSRLLNSQKAINTFPQNTDVTLDKSF